ncbi:hypothetical protein CO038_03780 [Candidatus Pacearchaeota archaeon CG_4_9_14_0_2_um_filter_39_13]|nr:hypothetical protein [Candidatus Pacearchaeota archaeon]OIO43516.1 MAG: hypothetical protein AUJ64_02240 [Candidatus Pacearchaeota archaeon CG1_02_39_14]PJC44444.1 MAG: hypothetical protein CO038_03780 [Candidatus Pacearchaeota archaeon CG_4_9_14_0_2_um_filter_39_13]
MVKALVFFAVALVSVVVLMGSASAGFFDFFKKDVRQGPVDVGVTVESVAPTIVFVSNVAGDVLNIHGTVSPRGGGGTTVTRVSFIAEDLNGAGDLNDASAGMRYRGPGGTALAGTCGVAPTCSGCAVTQKNYSCNADMEYYYEPGTWTVNASIKDNSANLAVDTKRTFQYLLYREISHAGNVNWAGISLVDSNQLSDSNPFLLTNLGNAALSVSVTGYGLNGTGANPEDQIPASNFSASGNTGGDPLAECDVPAQAVALSQGVPVTVPGVSVPRGLPGNNQDNMYFCIYPSLSSLNLNPGQGYSTSATGNQWAITIV